MGVGYVCCFTFSILQESECGESPWPNRDVACDVPKAMVSPRSDAITARLQRSEKLYGFVDFYHRVSPEGRVLWVMLATFG